VVERINFIVDAASIKIQDMSNPLTPVTLGTLNTSIPNDPRIKINYPYIMVGTNDGVRLYDVSTPAAPSYVTKLLCPVSSSPTGFDIYGSTAAVACTPQDGTSILRTYDATTATVLGELIVNGEVSSWDGTSLKIIGNHIYLLSAGNVKFFDISTPSVISLVGGELIAPSSSFGFIDSLNGSLVTSTWWGGVGIYDLSPVPGVQGTGPLFPILSAGFEEFEPKESSLVSSSNFIHSLGPNGFATVATSTVDTSLGGVISRVPINLINARPVGIGIVGNYALVPSTAGIEVIQLQ